MWPGSAHICCSSRALCQAKRAPRAAFPSRCLAAQPKRWADKLMSIESVTPSIHLILCRPLLLLPATPPRVGKGLI